MLKLDEPFRNREIFITSLFLIVQIWVLRVKSFFCSFWLILFSLNPDPDPESQNLADSTDPDPQHCYIYLCGVRTERAIAIGALGMWLKPRSIIIIIKINEVYLPGNDEFYQAKEPASLIKVATGNILTFIAYYILIVYLLILEKFVQ